MEGRIYSKTQEQMQRAAKVLQQGTVLQTEYGLEEGTEVWRRLSSRCPGVTSNLSGDDDQKSI